ncbi:hypothetical protein C1H46_030381 [Malus baccata]|uniref:Helicase ATP-binding domain-containing protein n=1 Tax=Malus baccata TaxID=106549 RepID=A0A540LCH8_MALBA|nr:hypothetical protein C1H46_030381 [Malus baccata]
MAANQNDDGSVPLPSTAGLALNIANLNIYRENMFLDDPEDSYINTVASDTLYTSAITFEELNLCPEAHNGTGKTTCFGLEMLGRVDPNLRAPQALCQRVGLAGIKMECDVPSIKDKTSSCAVPIHSRAPVSAQIVIGTPGTIKKLMSDKKLGVTCVKVLVFDEADQMLAVEGFKDDSLRTMMEIGKFSSHCQVLLFSATFNETITKFISRVVKDSNILFVQKEELSLEVVKHYKVYGPDELTKIHVNLVVYYDLPIKHEPSHGKWGLPEPDYEL